MRLELNVTPTGIHKLFVPMLKKVLDKGLARDVERLRELVEAQAAVDIPMGH